MRRVGRGDSAVVLLEFVQVSGVLAGAEQGRVQMRLRAAVGVVGQVMHPLGAHRDFDNSEGVGEQRAQPPVKIIAGNDLGESGSFAENIIAVAGAPYGKGMPVAAEPVVTDVAEAVGGLFPVRDCHPLLGQAV